MVESKSEFDVGQEKALPAIEHAWLANQTNW